MKRKIKLTESDLQKIIKNSVKRILKEVQDFASSDRQFDINSDEWKTNYDSMHNKLMNTNQSNDSALMNMQIKHHNGMKGRGGFEGELPHTPQARKKGLGISYDTIISSGLRRVNNGISPEEAFSDFSAFSDEQQEYIKDYYMMLDNVIPVGTVCGGSYILLYDQNKDRYVIPKEQVDL